MKQRPQSNCVIDFFFLKAPQIILNLMLVISYCKLNIFLHEKNAQWRSKLAEHESVLRMI